MMMKYLTKMEMQQIMEHIEHGYEEGRPAAAPKLAKKTDTINVVGLSHIPHEEGMPTRSVDSNQELPGWQQLELHINRIVRP